jgi:hypothetical protein
MKGQAFQGLLNFIKKNPGAAADAGISAALTTGWEYWLVILYLH